jgi:hypothetical protein
MIVLYSVSLALLRSVLFLVSRRVRVLERKYTRVSLAAGKLVQQPVLRPGNSRADLCQSARQQYELGRLVQRRDWLESRHFAWQVRQEKLSKQVKRMQDWKGRKLPYLLGITDVTLGLWGMDSVGLARIDFSQLLQTFQTLLAQ